MTRNSADTLFLFAHRHCLQPINAFKIELVRLLCPWSELIAGDGSIAGCWPAVERSYLICPMRCSSEVSTKGLFSLFWQKWRAAGQRAEKDEVIQIQRRQGSA
jgi:hypothetical protein